MPELPRTMTAAVALGTVALGLVAPALAQSTAEEAIALVQDYIKVHNRHDPIATLALYHDEAEFHLSMGRGVVRGVEAIARLEEFDAGAGSTLYPQGLSAALAEDGWIVGFDYVIEYSDVFAAMGLKIVLAEGLQTGFVFSEGKIRTIHQPELKPACTAYMGAAFGALVPWLQEVKDPALEPLLNDGQLQLTGATAPLLIAAAQRWRRESGFSPTQEQAFACAEVPSLEDNSSRQTVYPL